MFGFLPSWLQTIINILLALTPRPPGNELTNFVARIRDVGTSGRYGCVLFEGIRICKDSSPYG